MIGIYKIENIINHKVYIGQSNNIEVRWKAHKYRLQKNTHDNQHLQKSYNKYGENNFNFEIVELCCPLLLNKYETKWFNIYCGKIGKSNIYNLAHTGNAHNTSDETRLKISNSNKNKKHFFSYNYLKKKKELCAKKVYQYSLCGNFIKSYKSIKDALDSIGIKNSSHISACCYGLRKSAYGYIWSFIKKKPAIKNNYEKAWLLKELYKLKIKSF